MAAQEPFISKFIDDEEREIYELIESAEFDDIKSVLTPENREELEQAAHNTLHEEKTKISIRLPKSTLTRVKAMAYREGLPYQTLIQSILHKAVRPWEQNK